LNTFFVIVADSESNRNLEFMVSFQKLIFGLRTSFKTQLKDFFRFFLVVHCVVVKAPGDVQLR